MQAISLLVARYGALANRSTIAKAAVVEAIRSAAGVTVTPDEVDILEDEVRVRVSGARRAALFLKREAAAAAAAAALGKVVQEIR